MNEHRATLWRVRSIKLESTIWIGVAQAMEERALRADPRSRRPDGRGS